MNKDNTTVFVFDMDGVLVEYRYKDKVFLTDEELNETDGFINRPPVKHIVDAVNKMLTMSKYDVYILSVAKTDYITQQKVKWLEKYLPKLPHKNMVFVQTNNSKVGEVESIFEQAYQEHARLYDSYLDKDSIVLVDDTHSILFAVERFGFTAWHPTTFLNTFSSSVGNNIK